MYRVAIIGSGVVGTATGKGIHRLGHDVVFYDISKDRLAYLREEGYQVASSVTDAISKSHVSFVCVNTPSTSTSNSNFNDGKHQDLSQLLSALRSVTNALNEITTKEHHLLAFRSTMLPGTMQNVVLDYLEANCNLKRGKDYSICYNPEFLRQNSALDDFFKPDRIVIGQDQKTSSLPLYEIYSKITKNILMTGYDEAEMIKYASNCFLALKISYFNEINKICRSQGIDDRQVSLGVSLDRRIGKYGTEGGRPFGGACFPKDAEAMASFIKKNNIAPDLIQLALDINRQTEEFTSAKEIFIQDKEK